MGDVSTLGRVLLIAGLVMALVGLLLLFAGRIPLIGRLPGDIVVQRDNWSFYFPIVTSILLSLVLTLVLNLLFRR
jgi:hypothetical protein